MGPKEFLGVVVLFFLLKNGEGSSVIKPKRTRVFHVVLEGKRPASRLKSKGDLTWAGCVKYCGGCIAFGYDPVTKNCSKYYSFSLGGRPRPETPDHQTFWDRYFVTDNYPSQAVTWSQGRASCLKAGGDLAYFPHFAMNLYFAIQLFFRNGRSTKHFFGIYKDGEGKWVKMYDYSRQRYRWANGEPNDTAVYAYYTGGYLRGMEEDETVVARSLCLKVEEVDYP